MKQAVSLDFSGSIHISFTHICTIRDSSSDIVSKSLAGDLSGPGVFLGSKEYTVCLYQTLPCKGGKIEHTKLPATLKLLDYFL